MGRQVVTSIIQANSFFRRLKGLLGTKMLPEDTGLLLEPCDNIHTWGMNYPIDALFLNKNNEVLHIESNMAPNGWGKRVKGARKVLEINEGLAQQLQLKVGDHITFSEEKRGS
ncbi:MAG: DUF192 domain-containing protein [Bacillota bacterium]|nr:DUF192 domain-containing protein [Bacillota bacterium]MDW7677019.1 DUF192 domain-containing protein [Bacillota bacterium]